MSWHAVSEIVAFSPLRLNHLNSNPGDSKGLSLNSAWSMQRLVPEKGQISTRPFWFLGLGHTDYSYHRLKDTQIGENWKMERNEKKF